ncbi:MAG: hypothetical protein ACMUJM_23870 [bacterium]
MTLKLPELDDRKYEDLVQEALRLIPTYAPQWTNHNPSDPGITLIELFAYFTELLIYRLNRITEDNKKSFLKLLGQEPSDNNDVDEQIREVLLELRKPNRAVTSEDIQALALDGFPDEIARVHCIPNVNLAVGVDRARPGHFSLIIVPYIDIDEIDSFGLQYIDHLVAEVGDFFKDKVLITSRIHVVKPRYLTIGIRLSVVLKPDANEIKYLHKGKIEEDIDSFGISYIDSVTDRRLMIIEAYEETTGNKNLISDNITFSELEENKWLVIDNDYQKIYIIIKEMDSATNETYFYLYEDIIRTSIMKALWNYFHPLKGGPRKDGWPFGRNVYVSEIYQIVDSQEDVDYVSTMEIVDPATGYPTSLEEVFIIEGVYSTIRKLHNDSNKLYGIEVAANELVKLPFDKIQIEVKKEGGDESV